MIRFSFDHSSCSSGKDFEVNYSSSKSVPAAVSGFGGIYTGLSWMRRSLELFRKQIKQEIAHRDIVIPAMNELRETCDHMETLTAKDMWPFPTYGDILFEV